MSEHPMIEGPKSQREIRAFLADRIKVHGSLYGAMTPDQYRHVLRLATEDAVSVYGGTDFLIQNGVFLYLHEQAKKVGRKMAERGLLVIANPGQLSMDDLGSALLKLDGGGAVILGAVGRDEITSVIILTEMRKKEYNEKADAIIEGGYKILNGLDESNATNLRSLYDLRPGLFAGSGEPAPAIDDFGEFVPDDPDDA